MKHILHKLILDPLDFLEYFCPNEDIDLGTILFGYRGLKDALKFHTLGKEYAENLAKKYGLTLERSYEVDQEDLKRFIHLCSQNLEAVAPYLEERGFPLELASKYDLGGFCFNTFKNEDLGTLGPYILFNGDELDYINHQIRQQCRFTVDIKECRFLLCPSYDRTGKVNNLAFRVINPALETLAKWVFAMGRQATFGLQWVDPREETWVVEGFFDQVACYECGIQSVGLGSAFMSEAHLAYLKDLKLAYLFDSDETGRKYSEILEKDHHKVLRLSKEFKDPWESWTQTQQIHLE
jgi:hypothetical protein